MKKFDICPKIFFGEDSLDYLLELSAERVVVVTDPYMVKSGTAALVTSRLEKKKIPYSVFSEIEPDPSVETVSAGLKIILRDKPDTIIAFGGGSAIDAAKAMLFFCIQFKAELMDTRYVHKPVLIAIPTTSGTGSEVTSYAVISDKKKGIKIPLAHRSMVPEVAILDPVLTKTLPQPMVAFTGMDVLTHAIEACVSPDGNDFTNMYALEAAAIALGTLPALYMNTNDAELRERMYTASTMAGLAFTNSGLGLCHGVAHTLGAQYHIPHGKANAVVLPYIIAYNAGLGHYAGTADVRTKYAVLARRLGLQADSERELCRMLAMTTAVLCEQFEIPTSLGACGVEADCFEGDLSVLTEKMLQDACTKGNPVAIDAQSLSGLLRDIYKGNLEV